MAYLELLQYLVATVAVVTSEADDVPGGLVANTVALAAPDPLRISVSLAADSHTWHIARQAGVWAVAFVDRQGLDPYMGVYSGWQIDKFPLSCCRRTAGMGLPIPREALACLECRTVATLDLGRNILVVGQVEGGQALREGRPVTAPVGAAAYLA